MTRRRTERLILVLAAFLLVGCSTFERDWRAAAAAPIAAEDGLPGRWQGTWQSDANGHHGRLRCIIAPDEHGALLARYHATYGPFFTFEYDMPMTVGADGRAWRFSATADLGWLAGGLYRYDGTVVGDEFRSTYESKGDHGTFEMTRALPDRQGDLNSSSSAPPGDR